MQKEIQIKSVQVENLEKENDQLMSKLADFMRRDKNHEENLKQMQKTMQSEVNLLNLRLINNQVCDNIKLVALILVLFFFNFSGSIIPEQNTICYLYFCLLYTMYINNVYLQKSSEHQIREKEDLTRQLHIKDVMLQEEQKKFQKREGELLKLNAEKDVQMSTLKSIIVKLENHFSTVHLNLLAARESAQSSSSIDSAVVSQQSILMNLLYDFFETQTKKVKDFVQFSAKTRIPTALAAVRSSCA